jgi:hypothetical protein
VTREPLQRNSKRTHERYCSPMSGNYHGVVVRGRWTLCNCAKRIRGADPMPNPLGPKRRKYDQWAGR